jgi:hypothetical protein
VATLAYRLSGRHVLVGPGVCELHPSHRGTNPTVAVWVLCLRSLFRKSPGRGDALPLCRPPGPESGELPWALNSHVVVLCSVWTGV